jgi:hypothetical protein
MGRQMIKNVAEVEGVLESTKFTENGSEESKFGGADRTAIKVRVPTGQTSSLFARVSSSRMNYKLTSDDTDIGTIGSVRERKARQAEIGAQFAF